MSDADTFPEYTEACPDGVLQKAVVMADARLSTLAKAMEEIAEDYLCNFGMSRKELSAEGKVWVIAWSSIDIRRPPQQGENVLLRIWPGKIKASMYTRRFAFYSAAGEPLACAASLFVLMDAGTREFGGPSEKMAAVPIVVIPGEPKLPQLRIWFPEELPESRVRVVEPEEIDENGHLNNTRYLDWAEELLEGSPLAAKAPKHFWIQYSKELLEGDECVLDYAVQQVALYVRGTSGGEESFLVMIEWE